MTHRRCDQFTAPLQSFPRHPSRSESYLGHLGFLSYDLSLVSYTIQLLTSARQCERCFNSNDGILDVLVSLMGVIPQVVQMCFGSNSSLLEILVPSRDIHAGGPDSCGRCFNSNCGGHSRDKMTQALWNADRASPARLTP